MAEKMLSGGKVGVDIVPVSDGFGAKLRAMLARYANESVEVNVGFDPDTAKYRRVADGIDGRTLYNTVKVDGDASGLRKLGREYDTFRKQLADKPLKSNVDLGEKDFAKSMRSMLSDAERQARESSERVRAEAKRNGDAFVSEAERVRRADKQTTADITNSLNSLNRSRLLAEAKAAQLAERRSKLNERHADELKAVGEVIDEDARRIVRLQKNVADWTDILGQYRKFRDETKKSDPDKSQWYKDTGIPDAIEQLKRYRQQLRGVQSDLKAAHKLMASVEKDAGFAKLDQSYADGIDRMTKAWGDASEALRRYGAVEQRIKDRADFIAGNQRLTDSLAPQIERLREATRLEKEQTEQASKADKTQQLLADSLGRTADRYRSIHAPLSDYADGMRRQSELSRELSGRLDEQRDELRKLSEAFKQFQPFGDHAETAKRLNDTLAKLKDMRSWARRNPIEAQLRMDADEWDKTYARVLVDAQKLRAELEKQHDLDVRVKVWDEQADRLEDRLNRLRHERVDIPVDWQLDQERIIQRLREVARQIEADPDRDWELEADLDVDMRHAEEKLKKFRDKNDELKMDVDLETAFARAHLAAFTRPRTIDVFANFKGTDLGKMLNGITNGATGLQGVRNQFQSLVSLFDSLDKTVPKWSLVGAAVTSLGAGLMNLARTAGGAGASLVTMGKAALAAPSALVGLTAAGYAAYAAYSTLSDQFDVTKTALNGMTKDVGTAFWAESRQAVTDLANSLDGNLRPALKEVAAGEGRVVAGLANVVSQSNAAGQLPRIFDNTNDAIRRVTPGVEDLLRAFLGLSDQSSQYLPRMADYVSDVAERWARWVDTAERTGQVSKAMEKAIEQGGYLKSSVSDLMGVLEGTFGTLAKAENGIEGFSNAIHNANEAVNSTRFQEVLTAWSDGAQLAQDHVRGAFDAIGDAAYELRDVTTQVFDDAGAIVGGGLDDISRALQQMGPGISRFSSGVRDGFDAAFDAIGDAGPMFSDLSGMVGDLSRTFGGTFANALRASSPLISAMADAASAVASAFSALPAPLQSMIAMWATFGRAGMDAANSVKLGMLQNVQATLQYKSMLNQLGLSSEQASVKMSTLVKAMMMVRSENISGALSGAVREVEQVGDAAERTAVQVGKAGDSMGKAGTAIGAVGETVGVQAGKWDGFKAGVKGVWDAFGGWTTVAGLGISAGISLIGTAISDYTSKAQESKAATEDVISGMARLHSSAKEAADSFSAFKSDLSGKWDDSSTVFGDGNGGWWMKSLTALSGGFTNAAEAADFLGISTSSLTEAASGNEAMYKKLVKQLQKQSEETMTTVDANGMVVTSLTREAQAAGIVETALKNAKKEGWDEYTKAIKEYLSSSSSISDVTDRLQARLSSLSTSVEANNAAHRDSSKLFQDIATDARLAAKQMLAYGESTGQVEQYTQEAVNTIWQAREAVVQQRMAMGETEEQANAYADSLGLIPSDVTTNASFTLLNPDEVQSLVANIAGLTDKQKDIIVQLVSAGVLTDLNAVNAAIDLLMGGKVNVKTLTFLLQVTGNANIEVDELKKGLEALGMSPKTFEWLLNGNGNAEERMKAIKDAFGDLEVSDKTLEWLLECIDNASEQIKKANEEKEKANKNKNISFHIDAEDDATPKIQRLEERDGQTIATVTVKFQPQDDVTPQTPTIQAGITDVPQEWDTHFHGEDGTTPTAQTADGAVRTVPVVWTTSLNGTGNTTPFAGTAGSTVRQVPVGWTTSLNGTGNTSSYAQTASSTVRQVPTSHTTMLSAYGNALSVASSLLSTLRSIASRTWNAVVNTITGGHAATGGRISGPGSATSDSIPMWLSDGEMVIKASSVRRLDAKYGRGFLNSLNESGDLDKALSPSATALRARRANRSNMYASGGRVSALNGAVKVEVNPVVKVELPDGLGSNVVNNVTIDGVRASDGQVIDAVERVISIAGRTRNLRVG